MIWGITHVHCLGKQQQLKLTVYDINKEQGFSMLCEVQGK